MSEAIREVKLTPQQLDWLIDELEALWNMEYQDHEPGESKDRETCAVILDNLKAAK